MLFLDFSCGPIMPIINLIKKGVIPAIYVVTVIIVIVLIILDLVKAAAASKDEEIKAAQKMAIKRLIYGAAVFLVVTLVTAVFGLLGSAGSEYEEAASSWLDCWNAK